eukprot:TRINITY_DN7046_c0_g2_i1.p1 TRINITY_DN7046_c0_g2~~TRINITY_DN7046_c0_g2_i1.p1  ORF type:complete len:988 (-),score=118.73 TRINITY_DN7046_c0_g2_i1:82-3045(-)
MPKGEQASKSDRHRGNSIRRSSSLQCDHSVRQSIKETIEFERLNQTSDTTLVPCAVRVPRLIVDHSAFVTLTTFLTFYALVGDDVRLIFTNKPADYLFDIFTGVCLLVFSIELVLSCMGKPDYFGGFYFGLDMVSTVTLVLDITIVSEIFVSDEESVEGVKNSKTARGAAKAARVVRVLRLVRILKLYKAFMESRASKVDKDRNEQDDDDWDDETDESMDSEELAIESNVGKKLSDLTTRKCVILILAMMLIYPQLKTDPEDLLPMSQEYAANVVHEAFVEMEQRNGSRHMYEEALLRQIHYHNWFAEDSANCGIETVCPSTYKLPLFWFGLSSNDGDLLDTYARTARINENSVASWEEAMKTSMERGLLILNYGLMPEVVQKMLSSSWDLECRSGSRVRRGISLLSKHLPGRVEYTVQCPDNLRSVERTFRTAKLMTKQQFQSWYFAFYFDRREIVSLEAVANLITTAFVCVILLGTSMMFSHDAQELVLKPVEAMMLKVHMIRINPLIAAKLTDDAFKHEEIRKSKSRKLERDPCRKKLRTLMRTLMGTSSDHGRPMETKILEATIIKLGTLLALGFGTAGMNIISHNMQGQDSASVDGMVPGTPVDCIIGYAQIGEFCTFTEVLQTRVMTFVNQVAEIVHSVVDGFHGAPSRTTGDAFLVVWTVYEGDVRFIHKLADMAVVACALILTGINRAPVLAAYRSHPGLQQRLRSKTRVTLTFGLHFGWAIEGALGTEYKIDASYVSPNVSIVQNVEKASALYGTSILVTEALHNLLTINTVPHLRLIDQVKVRGSPKPMNLFSLDLHYLDLEVEDVFEIRWTVRQRFRARQRLEAEKNFRLQDCFQTSLLFLGHPDLVAMRAPYTVEFVQVFGMGYQNYSLGEWHAARRLLQRAKSLLAFEDGPCEALLRYMGMSHRCIAPAWWKGFHPLEDLPPCSTSRSTNTLLDAIEVLPVGPPALYAIMSADIVNASKEILDEEPALIQIKLR